MTEKELAIRFYNFLETEKKFPSNSLLKQTSITTKDHGRLQIDLLLLDTKIGEYIGMVDFSYAINPSIKQQTKLKGEVCLKTLKAEDIPFYLVFPNDKDDFHILIYDDNNWRSITKDEFPEFETLSAKKKIQEKESTQEIKELIEMRSTTANKEKAKISLLNIVSIGIGIITFIIVLYLSPINSDSQLDKEFANNRLELDSLKVLILNLKSEGGVAKKDTFFVIDSTKTFKKIEYRMQALENIFSDKPTRVVEINNLYKSIEKIDQKIDFQNKYIELQKETIITRIESLNALVVGIILALLAAAIGPVAISLLSVKRNQ